jgi:predicted  nucleic acid-binding Zn-ribbon protein
MTAITNELMYEVLKQIQSSIGMLREDFHDMKKRIVSVEHGLAQLRAEIAHIHQDLVNHSERMDRIESRFERVERRL